MCGVDKIIHSGEIYDAINKNDNDVPFYKELCQGKKVLELCCGTGRLTIPLFETGIDITGLDLEESMLCRGRKKAQRLELDVPFLQGDIRDFSLHEKFDLIFIPFNSLQNIYSWEDAEKVFHSVKVHLKTDGLFVFDVFNPDINLMVNRKGPPVERYGGLLDDGRKVVISEQCEYQPATQINRVTWYHDIEGEKTEGRLDMRCYYPLELDACLRYNGWKIESKYGDFDKSPFDNLSPKQICLCSLK